VWDQVSHIYLGFKGEKWERDVDLEYVMKYFTAPQGTVYKLMFDLTCDWF